MLRNVGHLVSGNAAALVLGVATMGILARTLGPAGLGVIVLVESYGKLINQIVKLENWQSLIRYGTQALESDDTPRFLRLVKFGFVLDIGLSLFAAAICIVFADLAGSLFEWDAQAVDMARFYSIALIFGVASTPLGILRLFDRFAYIAWLDPAAAVLRLALVATAAFTGAGLWTFIAIMVFVLVAQRIALSVIAYRQLRQRGYGSFLRQPIAGVARENPGMWEMIASMNATILLRKSTQEIDILAVGAFLGPAAAGIYQIARRLGYAMTKAGGTLQQVSFPHLAKLWAKADFTAFNRLVKQIEGLTAAGAAVCTLVLVFFAEEVVVLIAGPEYSEAGLPLIVQSIATLLLLCGSALRPALANMGLQTKVLMATGFSAIAFYITALVFIPMTGIVGASIAHMVSSAVMLPALMVIYSRGMKNERSKVSAGLPED
ncbi:lipopolysaccharide biosynthesis protein [Aurantiacibacter poecillastricola]|uniref:lipopolysaccharide biosynthesis protein n=1 Tax=Aurantiacibacter poecillastricola TaxID=3064385 RepID=UPI00273FD6B9|nr:oligosaccharide flippase family protein [Aurantiacibacter sp. 219JJ12-13]MDP5260003.1 oligosaccharide flippase family protein [Aurantiacibacter sp. 219JJ12-13]